MKKFLLPLFAVAILSLLVGDVLAGPFARRRAAMSGGSSCSSGSASSSCGSSGASSSCGSSSCGSSAPAGYSYYDGSAAVTCSQPATLVSWSVTPSVPVAAPPTVVAPPPVVPSQPMPGIKSVTYIFTDGSSKTVDISK